MMGSLQDKIYANAPLTVQNWLISLYGLKLYRERYGPYYDQELNKLRRQRLVDSQTAQLNRLNRFLKFCQAHNNYYRDLFERHHVKLPLKKLGDLKQIPVLEKETLRTEPGIFSNVKAPIIGYTGGTTGTSLQQ